MTPEELRSLADEATPGPWTVDEDEPTRILDAKGYDHTYASSDADARLIAVVPELARLCAELGEIVQYVRDGMCGHISGECIHRTDAALAKFAELNTGAEHPPGAERT